MKLILSLGLAILLLLMPCAVLADDYEPNEVGTIYAQVFDLAGDYVNNATASLYMYGPNSTLILDGVNMTYVTGSQGLYAYNFTAPADVGTYVVTVNSSDPTGYGSGSVIVAYPSLVNTINVWGDNMDKGLFLILALVMVALFIWKRHAFLSYAAAGAWIMLGITAMLDSESTSPINITDVNMALFWLCVAFTIACALLPLAMREKKDKGELYADDLDHELDNDLESTGKIKRDETRRTRKPRPGYLERTGRV